MIWKIIPSKMKKIVQTTPRTLDNKIISLEHQLTLLRDFFVKLEDGDDKYYKYVASALRVLVYYSATNKPLLVKLASKFKIIPIINDGPISKKLEEIGRAHV